VKDVRELSYTPMSSQPLRAMLSCSSGDGPKAPEPPEGHRRDEEASPRMNHEECLNERTATLPDATGYSGIGGRLLLAGSPIS
jgi:hypothetical protein